MAAFVCDQCGKLRTDDADGFHYTETGPEPPTAIGDAAKGVVPTASASAQPRQGRDAIDGREH